MSIVLQLGIFCGAVFSTTGWAEVQSSRPPYVADSIPAPGKRGTHSVCFDSSGYLRVLHNYRPYQQWTDSLIFRLDPADGRVLDSISIHPDGHTMRQMAFAYDKFWVTSYSWVDQRIYVNKIDTLGRFLGRFLAPFVPPADGNGICFDGDKLWLTMALDSLWVSGVFQTDTLGNVLKFVQIDNYSIGVPANLAYWPKAPKTLFVATWGRRLCQVTTDDTAATFIRAWPNPFPSPDMNFYGSTFDKQDFFWTCHSEYEWILKLDLGLTGVERGDKPPPLFPEELRLYPPVPSPTDSRAVVRFELPRTASVELSLVNVAGSRVRLLNEGVLRAGEYRVLWDGRNDQGQRVPSGVYFLKLEALGQNAVQRVVVVR